MPPRPSRRPFPAPAPAPAAVASPWRAGASRVAGTDFLFLGYLLLLLLEWSNIPNDLPILKVTRFSTMLAYGVMCGVILRVGVSKLDIFRERQIRILAVFVVWTAASVLWAYVQTYAFNEIRPFFEYLMFAVVTAYLVDRRERLDKVGWVLALAAAMLVIRNLPKLGNSARVGAFTAPYFLGDGNDFAWGMNVLGPLVLILAIGQRWITTRLFALGTVALCVLGNIGTQSRGGTLGLAAAVLYGWFFVVKRKALGLVAVFVLVLGVLAVAPPSYFGRMGSVANYEQDNSAQLRLQAWAAARQMAWDHPLGVGAANFNSAYGRRYNPATHGEGEPVAGWGSLRWISPHSIYFKVLGEYGYGGCALLIWLILACIRDNFRTHRVLKEHPAGAPFEERWPALLNMSIIGFAVSGIFLGGFKYPHLFLLSGLTVGLNRVIALERAAGAVDAPAVVSASPQRPPSNFVRVQAPPPRSREIRGSASPRPVVKARIT